MIRLRKTTLVALTVAPLVLLGAGCAASSDTGSGGAATAGAPAPTEGTGPSGPSGPGDKVTFEGVTYTDRTVVLDKAALAQGLRGEDGKTYRFAAGTPGVDRLTTGSVVILAGTAVRKVTSVSRQGDETVVETAAAKLSEAIQDGTLGWSKRVDWADLPQSTYRRASAGPGMTPRVVPAAYRAAGAEPGAVEFTGTVKGFEITLKLTPKADGTLSFELDAQRGSVKVGATGSLGTFVTESELVFRDGTGEMFWSDIKALRGEANLDWSAVADGSKFDVDEEPAFSLPFSVPIPIEVGPIPMVLTVKSTLRFAPALLGKSSSGGSVVVTYDSDLGFDIRSNVASPRKALRDVVGKLGSGETVTAGFGPVGFAWGWEFPRFELGLPGVGTYAFITLDTYMAGQFTPGTTLTSDIPPCQRADVTVHAISGYRIEALGFRPLDARTTLWEKKFPFYRDNKPCTLTGD